MLCRWYFVVVVEVRLFACLFHQKKNDQNTKETIKRAKKRKKQVRFLPVSNPARGRIKQGFYNRLNVNEIRADLIAAI